ncbi:MAG TPA: hypothetical protein VMF52_11105 [Steroidobacteraceae bacterium]|nr:hypothetical protein [Steroidobacteraceae bacterium]
MAARDRVVTLVRRTQDLGARDWDDIWTLTEEFYDVERGYAEAELRKRGNIALFRMNDALLGMASIGVYAARFRGRRIAVINTSHVLIRENWRGMNLLQKLGFRTFLRARLRWPFRPIYWFFDTFSYKSYLLLPRNFRHFWPRHDQPTPEPRAALIDELATGLYGPAWRPSRGIAVRSGQKRLRAAAAPLVLGADTSPEIRFFATANPGHAEGDMLVCLCPLSLANWWTLVRRALARRGRARTN